MSGAHRPQVWSHRGRVGPGDVVAENSVAAFAAASASGADGIELDVWRTADGAWVVHHDRVSAAGALDALDRLEIPASVPDLDEALAACQVGTVNVELKVPQEASAPQASRLGADLAQALLQLRQGGPGPRLVLSSFSAPAAGAAAAMATDLPVGLLMQGRWQPSLVGAQPGQYWGVHIEHQKLAGADVASLHQRGFKVVAWTVDDPSEARRLGAAGVDVVISNQVALVLPVLEELAADA